MLVRDSLHSTSTLDNGVSNANAIFDVLFLGRRLPRKCAVFLRASYVGLFMAC